jgi:MATE family multidrug resistance protein
MFTRTASAILDGYRPLTVTGSRLAGVQLAQVALTTTDLIVMGHLGLETLAAGGLAALMYNQVRTMCVGVVTPVGNLVGHAAGAHQLRASHDNDDDLHAEVRTVVHSALVVATLTGLLGAVLVVGIGLLLPIFGQDDSVVAIALPLMAALSAGLVPMLWLQVLRQFAVGMQRSRSLLGVTIAGVGVNLILDGGFVFGWLGLPVIGVIGIGVATAAVQLFSVVVYGIIVIRDPHLRPALSVRSWDPSREQISAIVRLGTPMSLTYASEAGITTVATVLMGILGPVALAAHNLVNQITYIAYQLSIGVSQAASVLVSRAMGRQDFTEPTAIARRAYVLCGLIQVVLAIVYLAAPGLVLSPFLGSTTSEGAARVVAESLLLIAIAQQVAKGGQNIAIGLMRGLGDTKVGFRNSLVGYWGVGVPVMVLCAFGFGWAEQGIWIGLTVGFGATGLLVLRRFVARAATLRAPAERITPTPTTKG